MATSRWKPLAWLGLCGWFFPATSTSQEIEFNRDIRPILSNRCFACHGPDAANRKTKLRFDIEGGARISLAQGRFAIVPGDPQKSEMVRRISSDDPAIRMPPAYAGKDKLQPREIELIRRWISQGAHWQPFWSMIPPKRPAAHTVRQQGWAQQSD